VIGAVLLIVVSSAHDPAAIYLVSVLATGASLCLTALRLHNMAMSGWWSLLLFVPIVNIFLNLRCFAFPEGYSEHRRLDSAAKVILGFILAAIVIPPGLQAVIEALSRSR
jgi:uncharacterized membrane protein YhaH (DUF805 family)